MQHGHSISQESKQKRGYGEKDKNIRRGWNPLLTTRFHIWRYLVTRKQKLLHSMMRMIGLIAGVSKSFFITKLGNSK